MRLLCAARMEDWKDQMRFDEVRRLLSQTDHSIIHVTMSVGY
jgi:transcriptional regulator GlxA family with amidase domain